MRLFRRFLEGVFSETRLQPVAYVYGISKVFRLVAEYDV